MKEGKRWDFYITHSIGMQRSFRSTARGLSSGHRFLDDFIPLTFCFSLQPTVTEQVCFCPLGSARMQTPHFGCQCPFPKAHATLQHTHTCWHCSCLTHSRPPELIQLLFTVLGQGKAGLDQTDPLGAEGGFGMHVFSSAKMAPIPLFHHSISLFPSLFPGSQEPSLPTSLPIAL